MGRIIKYPEGRDTGDPRVPYRDTKPFMIQRRDNLQCSAIRTAAKIIIRDLQIAVRIATPPKIHEIYFYET
jgi:hypothetical protein